MPDDVRSAQDVLEDHLRQGRSGSIEANLARNYAEDVLVLSGRGVFRGHDGLRQLQKLLSEEAPGARFTYRTRLFQGEIGFLEWTAESDEVVIRDGVDSYVIRDGKIVARPATTPSSPAGVAPAVSCSRGSSRSTASRCAGEEHGGGQPVVLVHGIPTCPALWRHVAPRLHDARVLAWEMVGYGQSIAAGRGREISVARQADYLVAWLRALGIERAVLAGHDLGAGVVQIAAVRRPDLVAGLFLTNAIGYDSWPITSVKAMRAAGALVERLPKPVFRRVLGGFLRLGHDNQRVASESIKLHWRNYAHHAGARDFIRQVRSLNVADTLAIGDALPQLNVPARVVWGAADAFQEVSYGERFARDLNTRLQRIEGGKHFTPEDHPDVIADALNDLIAEVRTR
jgi:pimeloyl-ACP methyl ester carboxylesterase